MEESPQSWITTGTTLLSSRAQPFCPISRATMIPIASLASRSRTMRVVRSSGLPGSMAAWDPCKGRSVFSPVLSSNVTCAVLQSTNDKSCAGKPFLPSRQRAHSLPNPALRRRNRTPLRHPRPAARGPRLHRRARQGEIQYCRHC